MSEIIKSYLDSGRYPRSVNFYRDSKKREIGLVIQEGATLHSVEIKSGVNIGRDALKNLDALEGLDSYEV